MKKQFKYLLELIDFKFLFPKKYNIKGEIILYRSAFVYDVISNLDPTSTNRIIKKSIESDMIFNNMTKGYLCVW